MIVDVVRTASFIEITRVHKLPYPGRVLTKEDQYLNPGDIIAEAEIPGQVIMLDIAKGLGLSPEETKDCLIRGVDENLEEGDVIAQCEKTLPRLFRAPLDGKIISYHKGQMALATSKEKFLLHAKMIGSVVEVIPEYGAVLSAKGSLIQGMWGNGRSGSGTLEVLDSAMGTPLEASMLEDMTNGQVLMGSTLLDQDFLKASQEKEIAGLILSSLSPDLIEPVLTVSFPVILLQGFGKIPIAEDISDLLQSNNGSLVSVNANHRDNLKGQCPEIIVPKEEGNLEKSFGFRKKIEVGDRVRMISGKAIYQTGKVVELLETDQVFENGLTLPTAIVKLQSLEKIKVPQQNLLIIG
jgi:hypothetical protein